MDLLILLIVIDPLLTYCMVDVSKDSYIYYMVLAWLNYVLLFLFYSLIIISGILFYY